jgi:hypothetical protein
MCLDKSLEGHGDHRVAPPILYEGQRRLALRASDRGYRAFLARLDQDYARSRIWTSENSPSRL